MNETRSEKSNATALHSTDLLAAKPPLIAQLPVDAPEVVIHADANLAKAIRTMAKRGTAAGADGLGAHHIAAFVTDTVCLEGIATILTNIANDQYSDELREFLVCSKGIPIPKSETRARSIGVGQIFYRIAVSIQTAQHRDGIKAAAGPAQFGFLESGPEAIVHVVQYSLASEQPIAVVHLDQKDAFARRSRASIMESWFSQPALAPMWRIMNFRYKAKAPVYFHDRSGQIQMKLWSTEGVQQGDSVGTAAFDIDIAQDHAIAIEVDGDVQIVALHDDTYVIGPPERLRPVVNALVTAMQQRNSVVQKQKSEFLYHHNAPLPAEVQQWIQEDGFIMRTDAVVVAGGVIAKTAAAGREEYKQLVAEYLPFFKKIRHERMPAQHGLILARNSGQLGIDYSLRATNPEFAIDGADDFDSDLWHTIEHKLNFPIERKSRLAREMSLAIKLGGIGPFRLKEELSPFAHFTSLAASALYIKQSLYANNAALRTTIARLGRVIHDGIEPRKEKFTRLLDLLPQDEHQFIEFYSEQRDRTFGLQAELTAIITTKIIEEVVPQTPANQARVNSILDPDASRYLTCLPSHDLRMSDYEISTAIKTRFGLPPADNLPERCFDCHQNIDPADANHGLSCPSTNATGKRIRHDEIKSVVAKHSNRAGATAQMEPRRVFGRQDQRRPDIELELGDRTLYTDIVCTSPLAPTNLRGAISRKAVDRAEKRKNRKYKADLREEDGNQFKPFSIDSFGALGGSAREIVDHIAEQADFNSPYLLSGSEVKNALLNELSVKLQKENSRITRKFVVRQKRQQEEHNSIRLIQQEIQPQLFAEAARSINRAAALDPSVVPANLRVDETKEDDRPQPMNTSA